MRLKLYQPPKAMIGPSLLGVLGLTRVLFPLDDTDRITGWLVVTGVVVFWIVAFTVDPKPRPRWMEVVAGLAGAAVGAGILAVAVTR